MSDWEFVVVVVAGGGIISELKTMNSLEGVVVQIQGLSSSAGDISRLHVILKQAEESLRSESTRLSPILNQLDPSNHSLGYLYILYALLHSPNYTVSFSFFFSFSIYFFICKYTLC